MRVRVDHQGITDLASDLRRIPEMAVRDMSRIVREGVELGTQLAREYAQERSGPHGKNYYKRVTGEMTGSLEGEYGPTGVVDNNAIGAGWRHGVNTDLPRSADLIGPALVRELRDAENNWFWPES